MVVLNRKILKSSFTILCAIVVAFMVGYWFYKYEVEDRDIGVVDYVALEDANDIEYPAVSMCFEYPFHEKRLKALNPNITKSLYLSYLEGSHYDKTYEEIDYANVTFDLDQYFRWANVFWRNVTVEFKKFNSIRHTETYSGFLGFRTFLKCFRMMYEAKERRKISFIGFSYNMTKMVTDWKNEYLLYYIIIHHPNQFLSNSWPERRFIEIYKLNELTAIDVIFNLMLERFL